MTKVSKRFVICRCVRKACPTKFHVVVDPALREILREEIGRGITVHLRSSSVVFIEQP